MSTPMLLLGFILSTLYGAIFHLWRGGGAGRLLFYLILSWIGFWAGHLIANALGWTFDSVGQLHLGSATLASAIFLGVGYWLSLVEIEHKPKN
ncbi:MAG: hypothetical protein JW726_10640 [Anaerolineales bacterium]|nr:hypothetical protein [Anaerolineales bacterium]